MILELRKPSSTTDYRCKLTKELDTLAGMTDREGYDLYHHYIYLDEIDKTFAIRVPGGTIGSICVNDDIITKIVIDRDYVVKTYPVNINEIVQKYVGEKIEVSQ